MVNIKGTFKKDDRPNDGLEQIRQELIASPYERRVVVGVVRVHRIVTTTEDGITVPTVKFDNIEALEGDAAKEAWELVAEAYENRTGNPIRGSLFDKDMPDDEDPLTQDTLPDMPEPMEN